LKSHKKILEAAIPETTPQIIFLIENNPESIPIAKAIMVSG